MKNPIRLLMHIPVPWVFVLTYLIGAGLDHCVPFELWDRTASSIRVTGYVLLALGVVIAGWSLLIFYRLHTTTVPGKTSSSLVTRGPYRFSRNPMYIGLTLAYLGEAGILNHAWPILLLPLIIVYLNWIVIPVEEARLTEAFGADYGQYRAKVRRWI
jgi:protein-S-isoprenylcysteine O-methyltransferase Ste14